MRCIIISEQKHGTEKKNDYEHPIDTAFIFSIIFTLSTNTPMEHNSIVNDNVVERPSSMAEKIASGDYEILSL